MLCLKRCVLAPLLCILSVISLLAGFGTVSSRAVGNKSITLICRSEETTLVGMEWNLYQVGERNTNADGFTLTGDFADYPVQLDDITEENYEILGKTLESYAVADAIAPLAAGKTDENGELQFSQLEPGLYLAAGKVLQVGYYFYVPMALLLEVSDEGTVFDYDAYPKYWYALCSNEILRYTVQKVWVDYDDAAVARPVDVTVDLFRNGELYDTVTLNEENAWEYRWEDLQDGCVWHVVERNIAVDYAVSIDFNQTQYLIKNTYVDPAVTTTTSITTTQTTSTTLMTTATDDSNLPQTGQLWWPLIPLIAGGVILEIVGLKLKARGKSDAE